MQTTASPGAYRLHSSADAEGAMLRLALFGLGALTGLSSVLQVSIGPVSPEYLTGASLGLLGWWIGTVEPVLRSYLRAAVPFVVLAVISLVAAGAIGDLKDVGATLSWYLLLPGIAVLLREPRAFRALLRGLVAGTSVLLAVVVFRYVRGADVLDAGYKQLLGINRNFIDLNIVWLVPIVLWSPTLKIPRLLRWAYVGAAIIWVASSQGRTGLIALIMAPLVYFLLRPSTGTGRFARVAAVTGIVLALYAGLTSAKLPWLPAADRLAELRGPRLRSGDEARALVSKKAYSLIDRHPFLGVGFGRFQDTYDPAIEEGRNAQVREHTRTLPAHNTYLDKFVTVGIPGGLLYVIALAVPLVAGIRRSADRDARAVTAGYAVVLFTIALHPVEGVLLLVPIAVALGATSRVPA